jgi:hypothetical protein
MVPITGRIPEDVESLDDLATPGSDAPDFGTPHRCREDAYGRR